MSPILAAQPAGWLYADRFVVRNGGGALSDFQVRLVFDHAALVNAGRSQPDGDDLRFGVSCDGQELLPYYIESGLNTATCLVWLRFPQLAAGDTPFLMFYGNPAAARASDPDSVFHLYDDFEKLEIDPVKWERTFGSLIVNGRLRPVKENVDRGGENYIYSTADLSALNNVGIVEAEISYPLGSDGGNLIFYVSDPNSPRHCLLQHDSRQFDVFDYGYRSSSFGTTFGVGNNLEWEPGEPVYYRVTILSNAVSHFRQSLLDASRTTSDVGSTNLPISSGWNHVGFSAFQTVNGGFEIEYVRVRRYADPEPVAVSAAGGEPLTVDAGTDQAICPGESAVLDAEIRGGAPDYEFTWDPVTGLDDPTSLTPTATPSETTTYTLRATDATDCSQTASVTITINELPTAQAGDDAELCVGQSRLIGGPATGGAGGYTYAWTPVDDLDDPTLAQPTASPAATREYTVTVTDAAGCTAEDKILLTVLPPTDVTADLSEIDFGTLDACQSSGTVELTLTNNGTTAVELTSVSVVEGIDTPGLALPLALAPGESRTITIRWTAPRSATLAEGLSLGFSPCDFGIFLEMSGRKLEALLEVSESLLEFGRVPQCVPETVERSFTLRNTGADALNIDELRVSANWQVVEPAALPLELAGGAEQLVRVQLNAGPAMLVREPLNVHYSSADCDDSLEVRLDAERVDPRGGVSRSDITLDPLTNCVTFVDTSFVITNTGSFDLEISRMDVDNHGVILGSDAQRLAPGESTVIHVRFRPTQPGDVKAEYVVELGPCGLILQFDIFGRLESSTVTLPDEVDFGELLLCPDGFAQAEQTLRLEVQGEAEVEVINLDGPAAPFLSTLQTGDRADSDNALEFDVSIDSDQPGDFEQTMTLGLDFCDIERTVTLRATVRQVSLTGPALLDFGLVVNPAPQTRTLEYRNDGDVNVTIDALPVLPQPFAVVSGTPAPPLVLAPGESIELEIRYTPEAGVHDENTLLSAEPCGMQLPLQVLAESPLEPRVTLRVAGPLSGDPGQVLRGLVVIDKGENLDQLTDPRVSMKLRFNKNLLREADGAAMQLDPTDNSRYLLDYQAVYDPATNTLTPPQADGAPLQALLGDSVCSAVEIVDVAWVDQRVITETVPTEFCLTGLCEAGGTRLVHSNGALGITIAPGPVVEYELIESGFNRILLADLLGRTTLLAEGDFVAGRYRLELSGLPLPPGRYFVVLETPTAVLSESLEVTP